MTGDDERHLRRAIELATAGRAAGDAPFGSLLVGPDGSVLAEEHNTVLSDDDITAHPELKLARWAARTLDAADAARTTLYTSCQPCAMCSGAIDRAGPAGGAEGTRTPNPLLAKQVRYQLRHSPRCQTGSDASAHGSAGLAALWAEL